MINIFIKASKNGSRDDPAAVLISIVITTGYKKNGIPSSGENKVEIGRARLFLAMTICSAFPGMTTGIIMTDGSRDDPAAVFLCVIKNR